jgi:hypothetical protein
MNNNDIKVILEQKKNEINKLNLIPFGQAKDLTGQIFNDLYVIGRDGTPREGRPRTYLYCMCLRCSEHNIISVMRDNVISNKIKTCGCLRKDTAQQHIININHQRKIDLTNKIFGNLQVIKESLAKKILQIIIYTGNVNVYYAIESNLT